MTNSQPDRLTRIEAIAEQNTIAIGSLINLAAQHQETMRLMQEEIRIMQAEVTAIWRRLDDECHGEEDSSP